MTRIDPVKLMRLATELVDHSTPWYERIPERWSAELEAFEQSGIDVTVVERQPGRRGLEMDYPLAQRQGDRGSARLTVTFPPTYPFFPARVYARDDDLALTWHRDPVSGLLRLGDEADHRLDVLVGDLLSEQSASWVASGDENVGPGSADETSKRAFDAERVYGVLPTVLMPGDPPPPDLDGGAAIVRYGLEGRAFTAAVAETLVGDGFESGTGLSPGLLTTLFPNVVQGRWLRDPDFDQRQSPAETWKRLADRIAGIDADRLVGPETPDETSDAIDVVLLLVAAERPTRGDARAVALWRVETSFPDEAAPGYEYWLTPTEAVTRLGEDPRDPINARVCDKQVVLVGAGAIGSHLAETLARAGVRELVIIDPDLVSLGPSSRQHTPLEWIGHSKVGMLGDLLRRRGARTKIDSHAESVAELWEQKTRSIDSVLARNARRALLEADLVIDATANSTVTRFLSALRLGPGNGPLLVVSATPGASGGIVFLQRRGASGCWACLELARADAAVPIPPADPDGWIQPADGGPPTFVASNSDLATIAHHAGRVALAHLADGRVIGGDYQVAALRTKRGVPKPATWRGVRIPIDPRCPYHWSEESR